MPTTHIGRMRLVTTQVSICVATEVDDLIIRPGSSSSCLDVQPLLDHITSLARENMSLKRDVTEKDQRIEELEAKLSAAEAGAASTAAAASHSVAAGPASNTE